MNQRRRPYFWEQYVDDEGKWLAGATTTPRRPSGPDLAALRRGIGRDAGSVPELWPFYVTVNNDELGQRGLVSSALGAEHIALSLYGLHQQSLDIPMHAPGVGLGAALRRLRAMHGSEDAIDRRFKTVATATGPGELEAHLRSLVTLLRGKKVALDYTQVVRDLTGWQYSDGRARARRRWGHDYFGWAARAESRSDEARTDGVNDPAAL